MALLAGTVGGTRLNWAGVAWAAAAGTAWAAYILGSKAAASACPARPAWSSPCAWPPSRSPRRACSAGAPAMFRPSFLAAGAAIGLLSSVIPYWLELEALRRIPTSLFGVWMSVQPAVAALIGLAVLGQRLSAGRVGGDLLRRRRLGGRGRQHPSARRSWPVQRPAPDGCLAPAYLTWYLAVTGGADAGQRSPGSA